MLLSMGLTASGNYTTLNDTIKRPCDSITIKQKRNCVRCLVNEKEKDGIIKNDSIIKEDYKIIINNIKKNNRLKSLGFGLISLLFGLLIG